MSFAAEYERFILTATRRDRPHAIRNRERSNFPDLRLPRRSRVMGNRSWRPKQLEDNPHKIRLTLDYSQSTLLKTLGFEKELSYTRISVYELDKTDPPLPVLVEYARVAGVHLEFIVDDRLNLPEILPGKLMYDAWNKPPPKRPR